MCRVRRRSDDAFGTVSAVSRRRNPAAICCCLSGLLAAEAPGPCVACCSTCRLGGGGDGWSMGGNLEGCVFIRGVSRPAHDLVEPAHGRVGMADLPLPSRADWPMGTLRKDPALALAGLGVGNGRVALAHVWLGHVHPVGGAWGPAPPAAGPPRAQLTPGPGTFNSIAVMAAAHVGVAAPAHQTSRVLGQTHPQPNAGAAPLARSPSVRPAGPVLERRRDAPRCVASRLHCQCQVG